MISRTLRPTLARGPWPLPCHVASSITPRRVYLEKASPAPLPRLDPLRTGRTDRLLRGGHGLRGPSRIFRDLVAGPVLLLGALRPHGFCRHGLAPMPRALPDGRRVGGSLGPVMEVL